MAPLVVFWRRSKLVGVLGFVGGVTAANVVAVVLFDPGTVVEYYRVLIAFAFEQSGTEFVNEGFDVWWSNSLRMFFWFGPWAVLIRLALAVPLAYYTLKYMSGEPNEDRLVPLFALAIVTVFFLVRGTSVIDLGMILVPLILLGFEYYDGPPTLLSMLGVGFVLMHLHPYFMEATLGWGATRIGFIAANEELALVAVPLLQPAMYGLFIVYVLCIRLLADRPPVESQPISRGLVHGSDR